MASAAAQAHHAAGAENHQVCSVASPIVAEARVPLSRRTAATLLLSEHYPPRIGGTATWFQEVYGRRLAEDSVVLTHREPGDERFDAGQRVGIRRVPMRMGDRGFVSPRSAAAYARIVLAAWRTVRQRAVAEVHCARAIPEGVVAAVLGRLSGTRYCVYAHGEEIGIAQSSRQLRLLMRLAFDGAQLVVANSENTRRLLRGVGVPDSRVVVIHPGVDAERFRPGDQTAARRRLRLGEGRLLLTVGRLQRRKGHDMVIRALPTVTAVCPDLAYVVVGTGEEEGALRCLAEETGVAGRLRWAGAAGDAQLADYYRACDVFVMPNREEASGDIEGFGLVFLEASACARPVVGGRSGGAPEAVVDGETGLLVEGASVTSVAEGILALLGRPDQARVMGENGRAHATRFSWDRVAARTRHLVGPRDLLPLMTGP